MEQLPWEKDELIKQPDNKEQNMNDIIYKLDTKVKELSIRLDHLENNLNKLMNKYSLYWEEIN